MALFGQLSEKLGLLFISTSGHTANESDRSGSLSNHLPSTRVDYDCGFPKNFADHKYQVLWKNLKHDQDIIPRYGAP